MLKEKPAGRTTSEIHTVLKSEGVSMAHTSIRQALDLLADRREVASSEDGKTMTESKRALGSNLARLDATTDEEIARHMVEDDSPELTDEDVARAEVWHGNKFLGHGRDFKNGRRVGRPKGSGTKELVSLRLDRDILARFRAGGPGWQTRLNDALREAAPARAKARGRGST